MIDKINADYNPAFGVKVSQHFINTAHNHYNYNQIQNKRQFIYKFNAKVDEYSKFGYDDYTVDYCKKFEQGNWQHYLVAVKDNQDSGKIIIQRNTLLRLINKFLEIGKGEFKQKITSGKEFK